MKKYTILIKVCCVNILLTMIFAAMNMKGVIEWSWWGVFAPIWFPVALLLAVIVATIFKVLVNMTSVQVQHNLNAAAQASSIDAEAAEYGLKRRRGESNADLKKRIAFIKQEIRRARHDEE